jgi:hypothetical protein
MSIPNNLFYILLKAVVRANFAEDIEKGEPKEAFAL